jgi:short-subunit dehydrogenase
MTLSGKRVLITGGSSGIGLALAQTLAARGARIVISGRRSSLVEEAAASLHAARGEVHAIAADVSTDTGRTTTLEGALAALGGLDILVNNAGGVRAGRLENTTEDEIRKMIDVDLLAPILLTRDALPALRASGSGLVVNVTSGIALIGMPFYSVYAAAKAGLARFGEALRRELNGEGVQVLTVYPAATDTPMMATNHGTPEIGFSREPAQAVADAIVDGIVEGRLTVIRGGDARLEMLALNRSDPAALDARLLAIKDRLEDAVRDHNAL